MRKWRSGRLAAARLGSEGAMGPGIFNSTAGLPLTKDEDRINYIMNVFQSSRRSHSIPLFKQLKEAPQPAGWIAISLLAAACLKIGLVMGGAVPFNSDEAVVALMGRHILAGERPVFFYGQAYMGSLDAYLVAAFFTIFDQHVWVIRLVQGLLYIFTILTTFWLGKLAFGSTRAGLLAMAFMAIPVVNVTLYTTVSLGGYGEALLLGNLILLICVKLVQIIRQPGPWARSSFFLLAGWGFLAGLGLWANGLTLVFTIPTGMIILGSAFGKGPNRPWRQMLGGGALALAGFFMGALPWWSYSLQNGLAALVKELLGSAVAVESGPWISRAFTHLVSFLLLGLPAALGMRPPWDVTWLLLPFIPFILAFWAWVIWRLYRGLRKPGPYRTIYAMLGGVLGLVVVGFVTTSFGVDPSGRYFLPFAAPLALLAADSILSVSRSAWQKALCLFVLVYQLGGTLQSALRNPPGLTTQFDPAVVVDHRYDDQLAAFLRAAGETRGYTNYWVAYPLAFLSQEDLIYIPRLPYHPDLRYTPRDDRYPPYDLLVGQSPQVAYIVSRLPALEDRLRLEFSTRSILWEEKRIGDYTVFYHLSTAVRPDDLDLGLVVR